MFTHYAVEQRTRSVVAPVCLTSPRPVHRPSPLKSSPQRTGNDFHGSLLDGRGCILLGDLAFQASPGLDFSSAASSPLPPLPRIFIYSTVNRTHERESLFIEVLKISSTANGIEIKIGEIFVFIGEVLKRNLILISDSFFFPLSVSLSLKRIWKRME